MTTSRTFVANGFVQATGSKNSKSVELVFYYELGQNKA
jgi:hypothetical protein